LQVCSEVCNSAIGYAYFLWQMVTLYGKKISGILIVIWPDIFKDGGRRYFVHDTEP